VKGKFDGKPAINNASANRKENITMLPIAHLFPISVPQRSKRLYKTMKTIPQSRIIKETKGETFRKWSGRFGTKKVEVKINENATRRIISLTNVR